MYVKFDVFKVFLFTAHTALAPSYERGPLDESFTVTIRSNLSSKSFELSAGLYDYRGGVGLKPGSHTQCYTACSSFFLNGKRLRHQV